MQQVVKLVLLSVLVSTLPSASLAQKSGRKTTKSSPSRTICNIESVPAGMVVVGYKRNSACSDGAELLVKRPENGDIICEESPLPSQFSLASEAQGGAVGTCPIRAFLIVRTGPDPGTGRRAARSMDDRIADDAIANAFASRTSNIQVQGEGTVIRLLPDDMNGSRHQRFIVELASGQTLLLTHNIDLAPRISALEIGDSVRFSGEYIWNSKGGLLHWTHHDPRGRHTAGWIVHGGRTYQ